MKTIKIKKLHPDAITPTRSHSTDAGLDIYANETITVTRSTLISTDIAVEIPEGYEGTIRPRSGLTSKTVMRVQLGTVDAGYTGEIKVIADSYPATAFQTIGHRVKKGDKIAQLVVSPIVTPTVDIVEEFDTASERGENGFGSTDKYICPECGSPSVKTFSDYESTFKKCGHCEHIFEVLQAY